MIGKAAMTARSMTAKGGTGSDAFARLALGLVALWLALEPPLRALVWWNAPEAVRARFHADIQWLVIGVILLAFAQGRSELRRQVEARSWLVPLAGLWAAGALLPLFAGHGSIISIRWATYLAFGLALLGALRARPEAAGPLLTGAAAGFLGLAAVVAAFAASAPLAPIDWIGGLPGAPNVRNLGYEAVVIAVVGSLYRPVGAAPQLTVLLRVAAVAAWWLIFWSGGRGALMSSTAALAVAFMAVGTGDRRRQAMEAVALMVAGAALSLLNTPPNASFGLWRAVGLETWADAGGASATVDVSSGRLAIWTESAQAIAAHPWFGIGEGAMKKQFASAFGLYAQPHNVVLQAPLAWGLPAGAAFLVAVSAPLVAAARRLAGRAAVKSPAAAGAAAALVLAGHALVDGTLHHPRPTVLFLVMAAVALTARPFDKARPTS
jgi:O-antigen ligase